jgi:hypothetical protein
MTPTKVNYIAKEIVDLLAARHSKDVFIPECKDGPTHYTFHVRMDAWAMNKSWAHPVVSAYEVKVSRADFLKDNKWPSYLPLCNQFYFVAPAGLIDLSELPAEAGLLTAAGKGDGARLLTKKKAPHRDITIPEEVYRYILMCRVTTAPEHHADQGDRAAHWRRWLKEKSENQKIGWQVSKRIRERASHLEAENYQLNRAIEEYAALVKWLEESGLNIFDWGLKQKISNKLKAQQSVFAGSAKQNRYRIDGGGGPRRSRKARGGKGSAGIGFSYDYSNTSGS